MRKIKFRGKTLDGRWIYGDLWHRPYAKDCVTIVSFMEDTGTTGGLEVIPETVGQYTGLKDKNGTEIYEGDILGKTFHWDLFVRFQNGKFMLYDTNLVRRNNDYTYDLYRNVVEGYCVIGNIFENPELIER